MCNLFWYPKVQNIWTERDITALNKYNKGTQPRDNTLENLAEVITRHLELCLAFCPNISNLNDENALVAKFVVRVTRDNQHSKINYGWNLSEQETENLSMVVTRNLNQSLQHEKENELSDTPSSEDEDVRHNIDPNLSWKDELQQGVLSDDESLEADINFDDFDVNGNDDNINLTNITKLGGGR